MSWDKHRNWKREKRIIDLVVGGLFYGAWAFGLAGLADVVSGGQLIGW